MPQRWGDRRALPWAYWLRLRGVFLTFRHKFVRGGLIVVLPRFGAVAGQRVVRIIPYEWDGGGSWDPAALNSGEFSYVEEFRGVVRSAQRERRYSTAFSISVIGSAESRRSMVTQPR